MKLQMYRLQTDVQRQGSGRRPSMTDPTRRRIGAATLLALSAGAAMAQATAPDPNLARNLAATCANCHGTNGNAQGEMKTLAGTPAERTIALMASYKTGALAGTIMHQIAKGYTDEQVRLIAGYFAAQKAAP
jgi:cytochrome subunit of sulfide dehydrogenase